MSAKRYARSESPVHTIIDRPHEYDVIRFDYNHDPKDHTHSYIDLTLRKGGILRRLRFLRPQSLKIEEGFPGSTHGMVILDIRHRQLDGLGVEVADLEASPGAITFFAAEVIDLDR